MLTLPALLRELAPLLDDPEANETAIGELMSKNQRLPDSEVARFVVARHMESLVRARLDDPDPRVRRRAVKLVQLLFARTPAAKILRVAIRDRSRAVRHAALSAARALLLDEVALPDTRWNRRGPSRQGINPFTKQPVEFAGRKARLPGWRGVPTGGFNPTGWRFGLYVPAARTQSPQPNFRNLKSTDDIARLVGAPDVGAMLPWMRPGVGPGTPYVQFEVPKASGGVRLIAAPRADLKKAQQHILRELLDPLETHPACHAFVRGRSTVTNATPHVGSALVLKMDLVDFFPTIHFHRITGLFQHYGASRTSARLLAALVTYRPRLPDGRVAWPSLLPQGAPTSPAIANLICRRMDARLDALAKEVGARYTRYADDLTFSFDEPPSRGIGRFVWWVGQICGQEGFFENVKKRRLLRPTSQQRVTGLVVNERLAVPREARRRFRAKLFDCRKRGVSAEVVGHPEPRAYLLGFASYVAMVEPERGAKLLSEVRAVLGLRQVPG
jgi:RNA-directed DNA polymerase